MCIIRLVAAQSSGLYLFNIWDLHYSIHPAVMGGLVDNYTIPYQQEPGNIFIYEELS